MIVSLVVASLFRQTMHYRHVWLLLALALVLDNRRSDELALEPPPPEIITAVGPSALD